MIALDALKKLIIDAVDEVMTTDAPAIEIYKKLIDIRRCVGLAIDYAKSAALIKHKGEPTTLKCLNQGDKFWCNEMFLVHDGFNEETDDVDVISGIDGKKCSFTLNRHEGVHRFR